MMNSFLPLNDQLKLYLDDLCAHGPRVTHISTLRATFEACRKARISLNPDKCFFGASCGPLLGLLVSRAGTSINPRKIDCILQIPIPETVRDLRKFLGCTGYYRRFIFRYAVITTPLTALLQDLVDFFWSEHCQASFELLKLKLVEAPIIRSPDWTLPFHMLVDTSTTATGSVLSQLDENNKDHPIYYASRQLSKAERNYAATELECLGMIFSVQKFRHYLLGTQFVLHVDHQALRYIVNRPSRSGKLARWMLLLHEYTFTVEYKPRTLHINADYLSRLPGDPSPTAIDTEPIDFSLLSITTQAPWTEQIKHYLSTGNTPTDLSTGKTKTFHLNVLSFTVISGTLYRMGPDHVLRRDLDTDEIPVVLKSCHSDEAGGHFSEELTARKIYLAGYWWPTVHKDCDNYVKHCDACQRQSRPVSRYAALLSPMLAARTFPKWGIDFIGHINPPSRSTRHKYIIVATDYVTKWAEAASFTRARGSVTVQFLHQNIISRFGVPITIITDNGTHFVNDAVAELAEAYGIEHRRSTPYHPQTNGQVERTNGILVNVLKKTIALNPTDWDRKLIGALWAYQTTYKVTTGHTPFQLENPSVDPITERVHALHQLTEKRIQALYTQYVIQARRKQQFDQKVKHRDIRPNDLVLKYNDRISRFPAKFATKWLGPYWVQEVFDNGTVQLSTLQEEFLPARTNVEKIRLYNPHYIPETVPVTRVPADRERSVFHISTVLEAHGEPITTEVPRRKKLKVRRAPHGRRSPRKSGETTTPMRTHGQDNRDETLRDNRGKTFQVDRDTSDQRKRKTREITDIHTVGRQQLQNSGGNNCHAKIEWTHAQIRLHAGNHPLTNDLLLKEVPITRPKRRYKPVTSSDEELFREREQQSVESSSSRSRISANSQSIAIVPREQMGRSSDCEGAVACFVVDMVEPTTRRGKRRRAAAGTVPMNPGVYFAKPSLYDLRNLAEATKTTVKNSGLWHFLAKKHDLPVFDENILEEWLGTIECPTDDSIRLSHPTKTGPCATIDVSVIRRVFSFPTEDTAEPERTYAWDDRYIPAFIGRPKNHGMADNGLAMKYVAWSPLFACLKNWMFLNGYTSNSSYLPKNVTASLFRAILFGEPANFAPVVLRRLIQLINKFNSPKPMVNSRHGNRKAFQMFPVLIAVANFT
ncbi:hypothetical protein R1sor_024372 [Riccia sorocarpa]|uniref:Integrase catalytic domain-containing protein n=1 Tax=Riccia sorocarpa TaxID=122646 RepID=A0ABD3GUF2_9MARC